MKRLFILVILFSMTLHCASRIGLLSSLYEQRHEIAYALGLIDEVPIAMCSHEYDFDQGLVIQQETSDTSLPPVAFHTQEIQLFCNTSTDFSVDPNFPILLSGSPSHVIEHGYQTPSLSIFHPPS